MQNLTQLSLAEQMQITEVEVDRRKRLFDLTEADAEALRACRAHINAGIDDIVDEFQSWQTSHEQISLAIGDLDTLERLRLAMRRYIQELFEGYYDLIYVNKRLRVGKVHHRIGVTPDLYVAATCKLHEILVKHLKAMPQESCGAGHDQVLVSLNKILQFDSQLIFGTYISGLMSKVESTNRELESYSNTLRDKIAERTAQLSALSMRDPLTGAVNRRAFYDDLRREIASAERAGGTVSLVFADVDQFKALNDNKGHAAGDDLLLRVAETLRKTIRETDTVCRYGGDEFCVILPRADMEAAKQFCDRFLTVFDASNPDGIALSLGVAQSGPHVFPDKDELVKQADAAMYRAKARGSVDPGHRIECEEVRREPEVAVANIA